MPQKSSKEIGPGNSGTPVLVAVIVALLVAVIFTIFQGGFGSSKPTVAADLQPADPVPSDRDGEIELNPGAATERGSTTAE